MITKGLEKEKAIAMRKEGKTYSQILAVVPVAKSTLSLWLQDVGLSKKQKQRITQAKLDASKRGGEAKHRQRVEIFEFLSSTARSEIKSISKRELFLIGVALYWAEGNKEKSYHPGARVQFSNMDTLMIQVFLRWLDEICKIPKNMIVFEIYLHKTHAHRVKEVKEYWGKVVGVPVENITRLYFKQGKISPTKRKNVGESYFGSLRIGVKQSSSLLRKIAGWSQGLHEQIVK